MGNLAINMVLNKLYDELSHDVDFKQTSSKFKIWNLEPNI